jgi:hypothetical protein
MKKLAIHFLIALGVIVLPWAARAAEQAPVEFDEAKIGDVIEHSVRLSTGFFSKLVVLPEGRWEVAAKSARPISSDGSYALGSMNRLIFQETSEGRLLRTLEILANRSSASVEWLDLPCKTKGDSILLDDKAYGINSQFCTRVGFIDGMVDQAVGSDYDAWARRIRANNIDYSPEMPFIQVTRYTRSDFLRVRVAFNPKASGIENSLAPQRHLNDWHPDNVKPGSAHERFYKALIDWAPQFASAVDRDFDGDKKLSPAAFGRPSLPAKR